ncbi:MAG TPA: glutamate carboxypeptidase, partial [Steroidobacteraceae bacterium]|nr:glutamate carboxypeptidase [Steroidobacteraceae bacterium]
MRIPGTLIAVAVISTVLVQSAEAAHKDGKVLAAAQAARASELELLEQVVNIDSGTGDVEGGRKVAAVLIPHLKALGMTVESVPAEEAGLAENTVATLAGRGKTRILMIGHIDTVFEPGTAQHRPFRMDDKRAHGPGVSDEKGGVIEGLCALEILHDLGFTNFSKIVFLMETSEERGSPGTRALIGRLLKDADVELNLEPGDLPDTLTVWRKGSTTFRIDVKGRAAHAGVAPQDGRNAALELIHQISGLEAFPKSGDGLTANLTVMHAGTRGNIIPEDAWALVNVRVRDKADFGRVEQVLRRNAETTVIPDTHVTVSGGDGFPPLPNNPATDKLAARAQRIYAGIGRTLSAGGNGGASESALAADAGVAALDGLGPVGGGFHSEKEFLELDTVTPRLYLLTMLLMDLGQNP